jgi:hypothetical protein
MGTRILAGTRVNDCDAPGAVLYDSVTDTAFGPLFDDEAAATRFLVFLERVGLDARDVHGRGSMDLWLAEWRSAEARAAQEGGA